MRCCCQHPTVKLAGTTFGSAKAPVVFGWMFAAHQPGAATAAYGAVFLRSVMLNYTPAPRASSRSARTWRSGGRWCRHARPPKPEIDSRINGDRPT
jgi:hypothetical protein